MWKTHLYLYFNWKNNVENKCGKIKPPNIILLDMDALFLTWPSYKVTILMANKLYKKITLVFSMF